MDIRRVQTLKDREEAYGSLTRVKVVKNKMAPPFREAKFDIIWGTGISRAGEILDMAVDAGIVDKSGAWFAYGDEKLGQGRERVRDLLNENIALRDEIEAKVKEHLGFGTDQALSAAPAPEVPGDEDSYDEAY